VFNKIASSIEKLDESLESIAKLAKNNWPDDKWELLHNHALKAFDLEVQRFYRLDDKAMKFITAISLVITIFLAVFKWIVGNDMVVYSAYIYVISFALFASLCISWTNFFSSLRLASSPVLDVSDNMLNLFKTKDIATLRVSIFKGCQKAINDRRDITIKKAKYMNRGYKATILSAILLVILIVSIFGETLYYKNQLQNPLTKEVIMTDKNETEDTGPDFDVDPSGFGVALEDGNSKFIPMPTPKEDKK
jgi:uncharacterized membrane protein